MDRIEPTPRTTVKRLPKRAEYDREAIYRILDEGFICHVGFVVEGQPYVIPTGYGRSGDQLFLHGSAASRMLRSLSEGIDVCVTVTLLDGLVLARSAFHHSFNYRSVVVLGKAVVVENPEDKMEALQVFTNHVIPGRWDVVREPNEQELKGTVVLRLPMLEASAKVRTGAPIDDEDDLSIGVWAGVLPMALTPGTPVPDAHCPDGTPVPANIAGYNRRGAASLL